MKKLFLLFFVLCACLVAGYCQQYVEGVTVDSYKFSVRPRGFKSVKIYVNATINNESDTLVIKGLALTLSRNGEPFAGGNSPEIVLDAGRHDYTFKAIVDLAEGVSVWNALKAALSFDINEYTVTFTSDVIYTDGRVLSLVREDIPLKKYLGQ